MTPSGSAPPNREAPHTPRPVATPSRVAVFASGSGTTFQALVDHTRSQGGPWQVALLITDRERPGAAERAEVAAVPWVHIPVSEREASDVERETLQALDSARIDLVALAGYLKLVPAGVVSRYAGRMLP